ncbi:glycosyltransferase family 4 protein [Lentibacter algarum]|uniref:glycosyltransferase family 4 protein n=1 Tax=Lentibacter algarum TaxID=576131 RepID=UPI001C0890D9|nr:glycosyltransferase family 4 protein [Lentibacter algarum]MBU2983355.1 glycosyltransferase family 4 protein [Lentibacter algarum]
MKIAYLCDISPEHAQPYSGGNARIYGALKKHVGEVDILPQAWGAVEGVRKAIYALPDSANLRLRWRLHLLLGKIISRNVTRALADKQYDVVFGAYSFQSFTHFKAPYPLLTAYTADATFSVYKRSEVGQSFGSSWASRRLLDPLTERAERRIYQQLDLALWPSEWLKREADALYGLTDSQSLVLPWGANIDPPEAPVPVPLAPNTPVNLLLVGRDWFAKGGPQAFETMMLLRDKGVDARLTVIGTTPPEFHCNEQVTVHPSLNKALPEDAAVFEAAFRQAHFMVQPSFESWGFAFCEAAAFGLPVICLNVGGVPVQNGLTGHALESGAGAAEFAALILQHINAPDGYRNMRDAARQDYDARLNWDQWGKSAGELFEARLSSLSP